MPSSADLLDHPLDSYIAPLANDNNANSNNLFALTAPPPYETLQFDPPQYRQLSVRPVQSSSEASPPTVLSTVNSPSTSTSQHAVRPQYVQVKSRSTFRCPNCSTIFTCFFYFVCCILAMGMMAIVPAVILTQKCSNCSSSDS